MEFGGIRKLFNIKQNNGFSEDDICKACKKLYKKIDYKLHQWLNISYYGNYDDEVICMIENSDYDMLYASFKQQHFDEIKEFIDKLSLHSY